MHDGGDRLEALEAAARAAGAPEALVASARADAAAVLEHGADLVAQRFLTTALAGLAAAGELTRATAHALLAVAAPPATTAPPATAAASPATAAPPGARPLAAAPPGARPLAATPPGARPLAATPPGARPLAATPTGAWWRADAPLAVALAAVTHPALAALSLPAAVAAHGALLRALAGVAELSAWRPDLADRLVRIHEQGAGTPPDVARALAKRCLAANAPVTAAAGMAAHPVPAFGGPGAVLVWRGDQPAARALVAEAARALSAPLQHAMTADENAAAHRALAQAPERRLTRLALDLHDGALQDVALIAGELRRLEDDLRPALRGRTEGEPVRATLETLASLVAALDTDLREVATSVEGPTMLKRPFGEAIKAVVAAFASRTQIPVDFALTGSFATLTDSQRITLFRVLQESLANVRQHADARAVAVAVTDHGTHVEAEVVDDGVGFVVGDTLDDATRAGRLGLVGMAERVRLLGGRCDIASRPGRGTSVRVVLARYEPLPDRRGGGG